MTPRLPSLQLASRLSRVCLVAFYTAIALLGSGGLHAIAPGCHSGCCAAEPEKAHTHKGCTHHHHAHSHAADPQDQKQNDAPKHCPDGCLICEFAATPAVPVAIIILLPQQELTSAIAPAREVHEPRIAARSFWSRGPPALG
jgi:hypothetical protein